MENTKIVSPIKLYNLVVSIQERNLFETKSINIYNYNVDDFEKVLLNEIVNNTRLIIENQKINNSKSVCVDICARIIIESSALLKASEEGKLNDNQKKLFLLDFLGFDIDKTINKDIDSELKAHLYKPYFTLVKEYQNLLGCNFSTSEKVCKSIRPYLNNGGGTRYYSLSDLINRTIGKEFTTFRNQLNIYIHPSYTETKHVVISESLASLRETIINVVLTLAYSFINKYETKEYQKSKWNNVYLDDDNAALINKTKKAFKEAFKYFEKDPNWDESLLEHRTTRWIVFSLFKKIGDAICSMFLCESFNQRFKTASLVKPIIEMISVLGEFSSSTDINNFAIDFVKNTFVSISMQTRLNHETFKKIKTKGINSLNDKEMENYESFLHFSDSWYETFKSNHDYPDCPEAFASIIPYNRLYYISPDEDYSFLALIRKSIHSHVYNKKIKGQLLSDYDWSSRIGHATAYKSEIKENKSFSIIPNLLYYLNIIVERLCNLELIEPFTEYIKTLSSNIREDNIAEREEDFSNKYKIK